MLLIQLAKRLPVTALKEIGIILLALGPVAAALVPASLDRFRTLRKQSRQCQLEAAYPDCEVFYLLIDAWMIRSRTTGKLIGVVR